MKNRHLFAELERYFAVFPSDEIMQAIKDAIEKDKAEVERRKARNEQTSMPVNKLAKDAPPTIICPNCGEIDTAPSLDFCGACKC